MKRSLAMSWLALASVAFVSDALAQAAEPNPATPGAGTEAPAAAGESPTEDDVEVTATTSQPVVQPAAAATQVEAFSQRVQTLEQQNAALETRLKALEDTAEVEAASARAASKAQKPQLVDAAESGSGLGTHLSAYAQAQYLSSQASEDQLQQGGGALNRDRFFVPRARVRLDQDWQHAALSIELDGNTTKGAAFGLRRAEGSLLWRNPEPNAPPYGKLTAGLQDIPFGFELPYGSRRRIFMERSQASSAFFSGEADVGASFSGGLGPARYAFAVLNGQPLSQSSPSSASVDFNKAKDALGRVGIETKPKAWASIAGGVSFLSGTGFHAGTDAGKGHLEWTDSNEDSQVQQVEIAGVTGKAAIPSRNFKRWALGADLQLGLRTRYGWSKLYGEVTMASNLDRTLFIADPIAASANAREIGYYVAFVQEVTPYALLGFRADFYDGNSDFLETRRGQQVPASQVIRTYSPLAGVVLPHHARLVFQYDFIVDSLARDQRGVQTDLRNNQWTLRLQVGI